MARGEVIGTGYANTSAVIAQSSVLGKAATSARSYHGGNKNDWFLPSKDELEQLYQQKSIAGGLSIGGEAGDGYWTSTEYSDSGAKYQFFDDNGRRTATEKSFLRKVRPVRAF